MPQDLTRWVSGAARTQRAASSGANARGRPRPMVVLTIVGLAMACAPAKEPAPQLPQEENASKYTSLRDVDCREVVDTLDPNGSTYRVCPGFAGFGVAVRLVDSGRESIDVVPAGRPPLELRLHDVATRSMQSVDSVLEWRVATRQGQFVPRALVVHLLVHGSEADPQQITQRLAVIAKLSPDSACVTGVAPDESQALGSLQRAADSAQFKPCLPVLPRAGTTSEVR